MMALCAVAMSFSSCEGGRKADPIKQPIAGHIYQCTDTLGGYLKVTFHMNYQCTQEVRVNRDSQVAINSLYVWDMTGNDVSIRYADNAAVNGVPMGGVELYKGVYDPQAKRVTLTLVEDSRYVYPLDLLQ